MSEFSTYYYDRDGWRPDPGSDCGYQAQADRIADYQAQRTPESVIPFVVFTEHPEGCQFCPRATFWEHRELPNGQRQSRCTECRDTLTWPK